MSRRVYRQWDEARTELLNLDELFVQKGKGDASHYYAWNQEPEVEACPLCGGKVVKVQDLFSKNYRDIIKAGDRQKVISLEYEFYKHRCLNEDCRHIFAKSTHFASQFDNVTYRLEDEIAKLVMEGFSYSEISERFSESITRQAVGQIFNRWVHKKEELRRMQSSLSSLCVVSGKTDKDQYTLILNLDGGIRVLDILFGVHSTDIAALLKSIGTDSIETILTDCNPTINDVVNDNLPETTYIIPVDYWLKLVTEDFAEYATEQLRWRQEANKLDAVLTPEEELPSIMTRDSLLESREGLRQPYMDYHELRRIVTQREDPWTYAKIDNWTLSVCEEFKPQLKATFMRLDAYKEAIHQHELHRSAVPDGLYRQTKELEEILSHIRTFSEEQLKARVLYSVPADLEHWQGVPLHEVIKELHRMNIRKVGGNRYEY